MFYPHTIKGKTNLRLDLIALPQNLTPPSIAGDLGIGDLLTVTQGVWLGTGSFSYVYQWLRDGILIAGETGTTYTTVIADDGAEITAKEFATDDAGTQSEVSNGLSIADGPVCAFLDSFLFDVNADGISIPSVAANNLTGDQTWVIWFNMPLTSFSTPLINKGGVAANSYRSSFLRTNSTKVAVSMYPTIGQNGGSVAVTSTNDHNANSWNLAIVRVDTTANTLSITLNGVVTSIAYSVNVGATSENWLISQRATFIPNSSITMPMIFNSTLSDGECAILLGDNKPVYFESLTPALQAKSVGAWELSSRDDTAEDLTGTSDGTKQNGVTSDGVSVEFCPE